MRKCDGCGELFNNVFFETYCNKCVENKWKKEKAEAIAKIGRND